MTIAEIESILRSLCIRHPNLDDQLLVTLLTAGGWEDKVIRDALSLFRSSPQKYKPSIATVELTSSHKTVEQKGITTQTEVSESGIAVPQTLSSTPRTVSETGRDQNVPVKDSADMVYYDSAGQEEKEIEILPEVQVVRQKPDTDLLPVAVLKEFVDIHSEKKSELQETQIVDETVKPQVLSNNVNAVDQDHVSVHSVTSNTDPVSLIVPVQEQRSVTQVEPPENLPLKPFESTPHIWPFSKYKEVFHGEVMTPLPPDERTLVNEVNQITKPVATKTEEIHPQKKIKIKRTGFDGEDEGLIFLTATTLLIILLLLAYMYGNGRI